MTGQQGYFLEDIVVGMSEALSKTVSDSDILGFADITGDHNPVHLDHDYAAGILFKERIAHGMLSAGFISAVLGTRLPGPSCIYLSQSLEFRRHRPIDGHCRQGGSPCPPVRNPASRSEAGEHPAGRRG